MKEAECRLDYRTAEKRYVIVTEEKDGILNEFWIRESEGGIHQLMANFQKTIDVVEGRG